MAKRNFWERQKIQRGQCPGPFKIKKRLHWGGAPRVFLAPILKEIITFYNDFSIYWFTIYDNNSYGIVANTIDFYRPCSQ